MLARSAESLERACSRGGSATQGAGDKAGFGSSNDQRGTAAVSAAEVLAARIEKGALGPEAYIRSGRRGAPSEIYLF